jgi:hypothetical protein
VSRQFVVVEPFGVAEAAGDAWLTSWRVRNVGPLAVRVVSVIAPHSKFRGDEQELALDLAPGATATFTLLIRVEGSAGEEIENAFVIVLLTMGDDRFRVLARLRVRLGTDTRPDPVLESHSIQRVGFSGEL